MILGVAVVPSLSDRLEELLRAEAEDALPEWLLFWGHTAGPTIRVRGLPGDAHRHSWTEPGDRRQV
jgi:hypothetical protein